MGRSTGPADRHTKFVCGVHGSRERSNQFIHSFMIHIILAYKRRLLRALSDVSGVSDLCLYCYICSLYHPDSCLSSCPWIQCYSSPLVLATNSKVCFTSFGYPSSFSVLILPGNFKLYYPKWPLFSNGCMNAAIPLMCVFTLTPSAAFKPHFGPHLWRSFLFASAVRRLFYFARKKSKQ